MNDPQSISLPVLFDKNAKTRTGETYRSKFLLYSNALQNRTKTRLVNSFGEYRGSENQFVACRHNGTQQPCRYNP